MGDYTPIFSAPQLRDACRAELFDECVPFWLAHGVDAEHGGFICGLGHDGGKLDDSKFAWYQGRGAWVFARIYELTRDEQHLEVARRAIDFAEKHCCCHPPHGTEFWTVVGRDGAVLAGRSQIDAVGYASLFTAEGLQEVARHEMDLAVRARMLTRAIALCRAFVQRADSPDRDAPEDSYLLSRPYQKGTRTLGHSMIPLRLCTQLLRNFTDVELGGAEQVAWLTGLTDRLLSNILDRHHDSTVDLTREEVSHKFGPLHSPVLYYLGHAIECFWFVIAECVRRMHDMSDATAENMLELACRRICRHVECAWDPVYGGLVRGTTLEDDHNDKFLKDKVGWVQQEGLVALLMVIEHTQSEQMRAWATVWFCKLREWVMAKFPLKPRGYALWLVGGNRKAEFQETYSFGGAGLASRKENYHHPRYLLLAHEICARMTKARHEVVPSDITLVKVSST